MKTFRQYCESSYKPPFVYDISLDTSNGKYHVYRNGRLLGRANSKDEADKFVEKKKREHANAPHNRT